MKTFNKSFENVGELNIRERNQEIAFMEKLKIDYIRGMLATVQFRMFSLPACLKTSRLK
jgi:hypothetical protein